MEFLLSILCSCARQLAMEMSVAEAQAVRAARLQRRQGGRGETDGMDKGGEAEGAKAKGAKAETSTADEVPKLRHR